MLNQKDIQKENISVKNNLPNYVNEIWALVLECKKEIAEEKVKKINLR